MTLISKFFNSYALTTICKINAQCIIWSLNKSCLSSVKLKIQYQYCYGTYYHINLIREGLIFIQLNIFLAFYLCNSGSWLRHNERNHMYWHNLHFIVIFQCLYNALAQTTIVEPLGAAMVIQYREKEQTFYYVSPMVVKTP